MQLVVQYVSNMYTHVRARARAHTHNTYTCTQPCGIFVVTLPEWPVLALLNAGITVLTLCSLQCRQGDRPGPGHGLGHRRQQPLASLHLTVSGWRFCL
eukprot:1124864-Pelagomonas_calceolata.AAC.2